MVAKFDFETLQIDTVNAFVYAEIDELVYIRLLPGFGQLNKVARLNKALYSLRRSVVPYLSIGAIGQLANFFLAVHQFRLVYQLVPN